jgi:uncharacterized protein with FMN-binding domain
MRRALAATLTAAAVALPPANAFAGMATTAAKHTKKAVKKTVVTRKVSGPAAEADRWGTVQITATIRKTTTVKNGRKKVTRKLVNIGGHFTYHTSRSLYIMQQALPLLRQSALQARSADIDMISGATYTSEAFIQSLQAALLKAHKV